MSAVQNKVAFAHLPVEGQAEGNTNTYGVLRIDSDNTHRADALPANWSGRLVEVAVLTASTFVDMACALRSDSEIDAAVAPANTTSDVKVGIRVFAAQPPRTYRLPTWDKASETMYLVHEASAANTLVEVCVVS